MHVRTAAIALSPLSSCQATTILTWFKFNFIQSFHPKSTDNDRRFLNRLNGPIFEPARL
jgi:hypothetical protein